MLTCERMGRKEVKIFANDVTPESVERIKEGRLIAETWHGFPEWGWYGTKYAVMLALGLTKEMLISTILILFWNQ